MFDIPPFFQPPPELPTQQNSLKFLGGKMTSNDCWRMLQEFLSTQSVNLGTAHTARKLGTLGPLGFLQTLRTCLCRPSANPAGPFAAFPSHQHRTCGRPIPKRSWASPATLSHSGLCAMDRHPHALKGIALPTLQFCRDL